MELFLRDKLTLGMFPGMEAGREAFITFAYSFDGYGAKRPPMKSGSSGANGYWSKRGDLIVDN